MTIREKIRFTERLNLDVCSLDVGDDGSAGADAHSAQTGSAYGHAFVITPGCSDDEDRREI